VTIYGLTSEDSQRVRYVGRTTRPPELRLRSHRSSRRAGWLEKCNPELADWLQAASLALVILDEVPSGADPWPAEQRWIQKLSSPWLLNRNGHDLGRARRRRALAVR
jgi:hypothetical protein